MVRSAPVERSDSPTRYVPQLVAPPAETPGGFGQNESGSAWCVCPALIAPHGLQHIEASETPRAARASCQCRTGAHQ